MVYARSTNLNIYDIDAEGGASTPIYPRRTAPRLTARENGRGKLAEG
jgi:hypothetical protein